MTNKQLFKKLIYQLNRLNDTKYNFSISLINIDGKDICDYSLWLLSKIHITMFHEYYSIDNIDLTEKLQKLKQFVDGLLDKEKIRY